MNRVEIVKASVGYEVRVNGLMVYASGYKPAVKAEAAKWAAKLGVAVAK